MWVGRGRRRVNIKKGVSGGGHDSPAGIINPLLRQISLVFTVKCVHMVVFFRVKY